MLLLQLFLSSFEFQSESILSSIKITSVFYSRRRRAKSIKYLKSDDDHRQHLNESACSSDHQDHPPKKPIQIEHPHLLSSSSINTHHHNRTNDGLSDRESLLKQPIRTSAISTNIDNFYEEIKEQQHQANLDSGNNQDINPYLVPKSSQPIRDHREVFYYEYDG